MHLALPPRKNSNPTQYKPRTSRLRAFRRSRLKYVILCGLAIGVILFFLFQLFGGSERIPLGTPAVVVVTLIEPSIYGKQYVSDIKENREEYAKRHSYASFHPQASDYDLNGAPPSWAKVPALRHAMTKYPHSKYFWLLDQNTLIMNPDLTIESIMDPKRLDTLMIKDQPIVLPDSVIKTFGHLHGDQIDFVLTQDKQGLAPISFILKRGDWAKFFLDTWFDPLYRSYNFQKAETHALEHIVQWHPTVLSKLALVPQRIMNSYSTETEESSLYKEGDFVIHFNGCEKETCETTARTYSKQWRTNFHGAR